MDSAHFLVAGWGFSVSGNAGSFTLITDSWDDFGYKTTFKLHYTNSQGEVLEIGYVKIAYQGMEDGGPNTQLPHDFNQLSDKFFSLGQDREYYDKLATLPDKMGKTVLLALRDVAADAKIYEHVQNEEAFTASLLRNIPEKTVTAQFRRITNGQPPLTPYRFSYTRNSEDPNIPTLCLNFDVDPDTTPPTNVHVLIGANGVGKTMLLRDFVTAARGLTNAKGIFRYETEPWSSETISESFVNVLHVSYSAFDESYTIPTSLMKGLKVHRVGLTANSKTLDEQFVQSVQNCAKGPRRDRWNSAVSILEAADPLLADMKLREHLDGIANLGDRFASMSSGHKIVILTITRLIELVEERSLVLLDEPETHLHPPLLSALTRSISNLVIDRNGVAIIATHSPVILQEVPNSCVWGLQRRGSDLRAFRLDVESFGESVSRLTSAVFHLDVRKTGYHEILRELVGQKESTERVLEALHSHLGDEGRFVLSSLTHKQGGKHV